MRTLPTLDYAAPDTDRTKPREPRMGSFLHVLVDAALLITFGLITVWKDNGFNVLLLMLSNSRGVSWWTAWIAVGFLAASWVAFLLRHDIGHLLALIAVGAMVSLAFTMLVQAPLSVAMTGLPFAWVAAVRWSWARSGWRCRRRAEFRTWRD